jgi:non-heme chloroperoxidase
MSIFKTKDGTDLYYKDWGPHSGQPVVFSHGWPLTSDAWEDQMQFLAERGYRCIAHDRRGHGRSSQPWEGNDMDTYASDLDELVSKLGLKNTVHVGHSTGGGEAVRYVARHGRGRVAKLITIGAIPPVMIQSKTNPDGVPRTAFDEIRTGVANDRSSYWKQLAYPFYGFNRPGAQPNQGLIDSFWLQSQMGSLKAEYDCIKVFSETDFTEDLSIINIPTLLMHGEDDQIVPIDNASRKAAKLVKGSTLKTYPGFPHGMATTHKDQVNNELLEFIKA